MNFFSRQEEMRTLSRRLVWMFLIAVGVVVVVIDAVLLTVVAVATRPKGTIPAVPDHVWLAAHPGAVWLSTLLVLGVICVASMYKIGVLKGGGGVVARAAGGERVPVATNDPRLRQLINIVEEIAIASNTPVPAVYVLPHETGINAFAAGFNASNAAITVTQGCLDYLTRSELQGVIAHEFSHIVNGDIRLNLRLMGLLFGLVVIASIGKAVWRFVPTSRNSDSKAGNVGLVILLAGAIIFVAGYIGLFLGRIIQAAIARKRESLADAAAIQFTRDPTGLKGALVKIGAAPNGSHLIEGDSDELAHMLFAPGMDRMFATHPPLLDRIKAIDPRFDAHEFDDVRAELISVAPQGEAPVAQTTGAQRLQQMLGTVVGVNAALMAQSVGSPTTDHIDLAQSIRVSLPQAVLEAAGSPRHALALMFALALDSDAQLREQELDFIAKQLGETTAQNCRELLADVDSLNALQRQPALFRLLPSLRQFPAAQRTSILVCLNGLLQRGGRLSPTKYALRKLAQVQLRDAAINTTVAARMVLPSAMNEVALLMAVLARFGDDDIQQARMAYDVGMKFLYERDVPPFQPPQDWPLKLDMALNQLDRLAPAAKEKLIEGMVRVIAADNKLTANEGELLRITCATLHCPLPPLVRVDTEPVSA